MNCIFVITPKECSFIDNGRCYATNVHIVTCAQNHRRLLIREDSRELIIDAFTKSVVDSPYRVKVVPGQDGRDILDH